MLICFFNVLIVLSSECFAYMYAFIPYVCLVHADKEECIRCWELELEMVVSYRGHVGTWDPTWVLWKNSVHNP